MGRRRNDFSQQQSGSATIEFAIIASLLLGAIAVLLDLTLTLARARDAGHIAGQAAGVIAQVCQHSSCVSDSALFMRAYDRVLLPGTEGSVIEVYDLVKSSGLVRSGSPNAPGLPGDVFEAAQLITREGDEAVGVRVTIPVNSFFARLAAASSAHNGTVSRVAVAVRTSAGF